MTAVELIEKKRDGQSLTANEIRWLIDSYTNGSVTDYQMAAMTMAVFLNGLSGEELAVWTDAMMHSGEVLNFDHINKRKVDKHSTGGVGDKVSIPLGPMVAACGVAIPMMSGRGLGHTGGTLDKLESIPGFTTGLDQGQFTAILERHGLVLAGQSKTLVPADRKLYALRDATGTVPSIPLIASSIMSKKLAEDLDGLVLDVKVGSGAFMKDIDAARTLAETMVGIGSAHGTSTVAYLTAMDEPLGLEVGNANEIAESISVLRGHGPADLTEVTMVLAAEMLVLGRIDDTIDAARNRLEEVVASGAALELFGQVIEAQGGNRNVIDDLSLLPIASHSFELKAQESGSVRRVNA
ncbi:MAG: thymidine phosphorylase, partial [Acidimicrobiia bacterium]|nr:thymidine phosphorylase [Acidimicrobiia bacterium]